MRRRSKCVTPMCKHPVSIKKLGVCNVCYQVLMKHKDASVKEIRELIKKNETTANRLRTVLQLRRKLTRQKGDA